MMNLNKILRLSFSIGITLFFVALGCYLIDGAQKSKTGDATLELVIGYANVIFFSLLLLFLFVKLIRNQFHKPEN